MVNPRKPLLKSGMMQTLPKRDKDGCVVLCMKASGWDPQEGLFTFLLIQVNFSKTLKAILDTPSLPYGDVH